MCRSGYSICHNTNIVTKYGLTKEICSSYPQNNHFYASLSSTFNGYICKNNDTSAKNGVFGCGLDIKSNWLWTISEWVENNIPVSCGPYTAALNQYNFNEDYGWIIYNLSKGKEQEKYFTKHLNWDYGGVLCCRNLGESIYEPQYIKNLISFFSARISEFISLFITIIIIILSIKQTLKKKLKNNNNNNNIDIRKILTFLAYCVYLISVLELIWNIITIWLIVYKYEKVYENINCKTRWQGITIFYGIYKMVFYLFMIYKIQVSFIGSIYSYHNYIYILLKIFIILFIIIGYGSLLFSENKLIKYKQFGAVIGGGYDCYLNINKWVLWIGGIIDIILSIIFSFMFGYKLLIVMKINNESKINSKSSKSLQALIFKNTLLSFIALLSTWIFYYFGFQGTNFLGWFASLDFLINNLCIFLMFKHNQILFKKLCCNCFIYCGLQCAKENTKYLRKTDNGSSISPTTSKKHSIIPAISPPSTSPPSTLQMVSTDNIEQNMYDISHTNNN